MGLSLGWDTGPNAGIMERRGDRTGILTHVLLFDTVPRTVHSQLHIDIFCQFASPRSASMDLLHNNEVYTLAASEPWN